MAMLARLLTWSLTNAMSMLSCTPVNVLMHVQCVFVMNVNAQNTAQFAWQAPHLRHNDLVSPQVVSVSVSANARRTGNQARQQLGEHRTWKNVVGKGGDGVADEGWVEWEGLTNHLEETATV